MMDDQAVMTEKRPFFPLETISVSTNFDTVFSDVLVK
ncbi:hypothetical protein M493_07010 [Geobacillus genomosp. 3]|uniref:Uncharacterized protein n=1 Tax=Geobacillus genomosp. 3 TaxID=1921421 RepID=S6A1B8_GEOG3|nr:hypothetical protein M493_07010 [Geobacillus genomosp. 3]